MTVKAAARVRRFSANTQGRDFCVGDIHGMFYRLDELLSAVAFDFSVDRLFSVGDLVDRGEDSARCLLYLNQPWFHAIRGNHEDMLLRSHADPKDRTLRQMWLENGGEWWLSTTETIQRNLIHWLQPLPYVIEVETAAGLVGLVHADLTPGLSWTQFVRLIDAQDEHTATVALWSRQRAKLHKIAGPVRDIHAIYCGHTVFPDPVSAGNVHFIDTGAYLGRKGKLTMVDIAIGPNSAISI